MGTRSNLRQVHFQSPEELVERLDAVAEVLETNRADLLIEAMQIFVQKRADDEEFQDLIATQYYDDQLGFEQVEQLVGTETAQRLRLLKANLDTTPFNLDPPADVEVYDGKD